MSDGAFEIEKLGCWTIVVVVIAVLCLILWKVHISPGRASSEKVAVVRCVEFDRVPDVPHLSAIRMGV